MASPGTMKDATVAGGGWQHSANLALDCTNSQKWGGCPIHNKDASEIGVPASQVQLMWCIVCISHETVYLESFEAYSISYVLRSLCECVAGERLLCASLPRLGQEQGHQQGQRATVSIPTTTKPLWHSNIANGGSSESSFVLVKYLLWGRPWRLCTFI